MFTYPPEATPRIALFGTSFKHKVTSIAQTLSLEAENDLSATIGVDPGTSYTVRVYGPSCDVQQESLPLEATVKALRDASATATSVRELGGMRLNVLPNGTRVLQ